MFDAKNAEKIGKIFKWGFTVQCGYKSKRLLCFK